LQIGLRALGLHVPPKHSLKLSEVSRPSCFPPFLRIA
jgi:hypothetical protein